MSKIGHYSLLNRVVERVKVVTVIETFILLVDGRYMRMVSSSRLDWLVPVPFDWYSMERLS